ncbi:hypothetical protein 1013_scaffold47_00069 [Bacteriophage sp.]|nr:hypothetical protein 1013_scaffold47_00069 [Bacteriophage sp.]
METKDATAVHNFRLVNFLTQSIFFIVLSPFRLSAVTHKVLLCPVLLRSPFAHA